MNKKEIQEQHPKEVAILLEIYKRSITHIEGYEKITWATSFQIEEVIEAMGVHTAHLTDQIKSMESENEFLITEHDKALDKIKSMENYISDVDGQVKELRENFKAAEEGNEIKTQYYEDKLESCQKAKDEYWADYQKELFWREKFEKATIERDLLIVDLQSQLESLQKERSKVKLNEVFECDGKMYCISLPGKTTQEVNTHKHIVSEIHPI